MMGTGISSRKKNTGRSIQKREIRRPAELKLKEEGNDRLPDFSDAFFEVGREKALCNGRGQEKRLWLRGAFSGGGKKRMCGKGAF